MASEYILEMNNITKEFPGVKALDDVNLKVKRGEIHALCGENGAAHVFAAQKGATPKDILVLDERARKFAEASAKLFGYDRSDAEGAGAAGGLGYAFLQYLNADCKPGIQLLLETIGFKELVRDADLIITGEGSADRQTLMGKLPMGILLQSGDVPVCLIAGRVSNHEELLDAGFAHVPNPC